MNKLRGKLIELIILFNVIIFYSLSCWLREDVFIFVKLWSFLTILLVYAYFRLQKKVILFEPLSLFCLYYLTIPITNFYYIITEFESAIYLDRATLQASYLYLFSLSAFYYFVGLLSIILGYSVINKPALQPIKFETYKEANPYVINMIIIGMLIVGMSNFLYNVLIYAGGNPVTYLSNIAIRKMEFEDTGGSTLGYLFFYMGTYLLTYNYLRRKEKPDMFLALVIIIGVVLMASTGRIYATMAYFLSYIAIFYFNSLINKKEPSNRKYVLYLVLIPVLGTVLYFLRVASSIFIGSNSKNSLSDMAGNFVELLGFYAIDKGNTPNVAVFMKTLDSWEAEHGFLGGTSLISWIINAIPKNIRPEGYQPSVMIKDLWYSHHPGGALPPTGVGEMYMNFGPVGPFLGMFVLGLVIKIFYVSVVKSRSYWNYLLLAQILFSFILLYPKGEFDNLNLIYVFLAYFPLLLVRGISYLFNNVHQLNN